MACDPMTKHFGKAAVIALAVAALGCGFAAHGSDGHRGTTTPARPGDGYIPTGASISPFDDDDPAIANLDPALRRAMQHAATDARRDGVTIRLDSGWRSARYQQLLLDRAVTTYGSLEAARRYVNTPEKSTHVTGHAVDLGPTDADGWLAQHGNAYGLCRIYANEMWHFERVVAPGGTCPATIADASGG
jgi:D-alanyl-D-alanine carboxypeptidase